MDANQFQKACDKTATLILCGMDLSNDFEPKRCPEDSTCPEHCLWMLDQANEFYRAGKIEKANRWLGFVQGVAAAKDWATLEELKKANMPEGDTFDGDRV